MSDLIKHSTKLHERRDGDRSYWIFWCTACGCCHSFLVAPGRWSFEGKIESPTFLPSLRLFIPAVPATEEDAATPERTVCHLNLTAGSLIYHGDNPHEYKGRTVPLAEIPPDCGT